MHSMSNFGYPYLDKQTGKLHVDVEYVHDLHRQMQVINNHTLKDIVLHETNKSFDEEVEVSPIIIEYWHFVCLSNMYFILEGIYKISPDAFMREITEKENLNG